MKKFLITVSLILLALTGFANHLKGGFFTYEYLGPGINNPNNLRYRIVLTVYMECNANDAQVGGAINFSFFDAGTSVFIQNVNVQRGSVYNLGKDSDEQCISGNQAGCYYKIVEYDLGSVELAPNSNGYTVAYQRCCRIAGIQNIANSSSIGNTYAITIPGGQNATNNSAKFLVNDTIVVCSGSYFEYSFTAFDQDGNDLSYSFCEAWIGGSQGNAAPTTATPPPYSIVPYNGGFSGGQPLGNQVSIDPSTGVIKGIAPGFQGEYVVTVCVNEIKNGVVIAQNRKELHIQVGNCVPIKAVLDPVYPTCDGFTRNFSNNIPPNSAITSYFWDFGDGNSSVDVSPTHTYADTGIYTLKLVVNRGELCSDSTTALVKVYPGFFPGFTIAGVCVNNPTQFTDTTKTAYGVVDTWKWDFGVSGTNSDTSRQQNPTYTYSSTGLKPVRFIVTNSKGCIDTVFKDIEIVNRPPLSVAFNDTLICNGDDLQLQANGIGNFTWTPNTNIVNANTATPTVSPTVTTKYFVRLEDHGCINDDSVNVRVVNFVTLQPLVDTAICRGDSLQLFASTDGLQFQWSPSEGLDNPNVKNPKARPDVTTIYEVTAIIGHCTASDEVTVKVVPYPGADAGADTIICFNSSAILNGRIEGSEFLWTPANTLTNATTLTPTATPGLTTSYVLTVRDTLGCPKPGRDTVMVTVLSKINAYAGKDTSVVVGQPLQLLATGGESYLWVPGTSLNDPAIANPIGVYNGSFENIRYTVLVSDAAGCTDSAFINVNIFKTNPEIFVPTGFTPNGDGKNDVVRPIAVGITKIEYFRIYNRWGQLVFSTNINGHGWDGRINGKEQSTNTFVWMVKGYDYTGKEVFAKGVVTLIR